MILVGGIGNIFFGDDGFGVEVVRQLAERRLPEGVRVVDFGIRGLDLAYALPDYDAAILVDVTARGGRPGTLYVIEPSVHGSDAIDPHGMTPDRVLRWIDPGRAPKFLRLVGCEPATFGAEGIGAEGLSEPVRAAVHDAVVIVDQLIAEARHA
jgi:hydrogenase maturation protease